MTLLETRSAVRIEQATATDRAAMVDLLRGMLQHCEPMGGDVPPEPQNASFFVDQIFLPAIASGAAAIFVARADQEPVGAVFWIVDPVQYLGAPKGAVGFGTYVLPGFRRQGIGVALRQESLLMLRGLGVQRLTVQTHCANEAGNRSLQSLGFKPVSISYRLNL